MFFLCFPRQAVKLVELGYFFNVLREHQSLTPLNEGLSERLQKLQNKAARLIMNLKNEHGHSVLARNSLGWELLEKRRIEMKELCTKLSIS